MKTNKVIAVSVLGEIIKIGALGIVLFLVCMLAAHIASSEADKARIEACKPIITKAIESYATDNGQAEAIRLSHNPQITTILSTETETGGPWLKRTKETEPCFQKDIWEIKYVSEKELKLSSPQETSWFPRK